MLDYVNSETLQAAQEAYPAAPQARLLNGDDAIDFFYPVINYTIANLPDSYLADQDAEHFRRRHNIEELREACRDIGNDFLDARDEGPASIPALDAAQDLCEIINDYLFDLDEDVIRQISRQYLADAEHVDQSTPGLAAFVSDALFCYYGHRF